MQSFTLEFKVKANIQASSPEVAALQMIAGLADGLTTMGTITIMVDGKPYTVKAEMPTAWTN